MSRFLGTSHHADKEAAALAEDHPAVVEGTTLFPKSVRAPGNSPRLLVSGVNNAKTGGVVMKGPWAGCKIFTLSLVERETCPPSCETWRECLTPDARILTDDLRWILLDSVKAGQRIAAFDEFAIEGKSRMTRLAIVEKVGRAKRPCYRVITNRGEVIASEDHLWLQRRSRLHYKWRRTDRLRPGDKLQYFGKPWEVDTSYEAGRLRGFVEGEGYCTTLWRPNQTQAKSQVGWAQRPTKLCDEIINVANGLGFNTARYERIAGVKSTAITHVDIRGGWKAVAEFIGRIRPTRIIERAPDIWVNHAVGGRGGLHAVVERIEDVGEQEVVTIQTSTKTMVAEGFFTHNCYGNAMPLARRHRPDDDLMPRLEREIGDLIAKHGRIAVRLHVLGDFYSVKYARFWRAMLQRHAGLHVWGYTARGHAEGDLDIFLAVAHTNMLFRERHIVRYSNAPYPDMATGVIWRQPEGPVVPEGTVCPASMEATAACGTCGLCWAPEMREKRIVFVGHGMRSRPRKTTTNKED